jgi:NAD(P)-dependent dehydrogenase (short-subunit alcohol dehydrogenase family)
MPGRFADQVVVVAGAGSGIGAASAARLAGEGARVIVGDLDTGRAETVAGQITADGGVATAVTYDQADEDSIAALIGTAVRAYGGLDGLHANASDTGAIAADTDAVAVSLEAFDRSIEVNLRGYLLLTRHAVPAMLERGRGAIVYTSSGAAFVGEEERVAYAAAKAGVNALMRHVAVRWGKRGIRSNAVAPGLVLDAATRARLPDELREAVMESQPSGRLGEPADVAAAVAYLLSTDADWVLGQVLSIDGGATMR